MCGIAGFAGSGSLETLRAMADVLVHRGPDAEGLWCDPAAGVYLGHRRLSIVDLSGGSQPMWTRDGRLGIVFNGEIYNHLELRQALKQQGCVFESDHSDTEVLLHGYRLWGEELPGKLNGMWAFVLFDRDRQRLYGSRDRFGKKPFFYTLQQDTLVFASELTAVVKHPAVEARVARRSLQKYFAYSYIPAPHTLYERIHKLPGGHSLTFDLLTRQLRVSRYWEFVIEPFEQLPANPEAEWGEQLRALLEAAVQRRLMADVPLGAFLSGGIDSSAVAYYAAKHVGGERLNTFSIGFEEETFNEAPYAAQVAGLIQSNHRQETLSVERARELLPTILRQLDEPMGDSSLLPTYLLCQHTRRHVTVALGGDGGDELFAGYDPFRALRWAEWYQRLIPKPLHRGIALLMARLPVSHRYMSLDFKIKRALRGMDHPPRYWLPVWMSSLSPAEFNEFFQEPVALEEVFEEAVAAWEGCASTNLVDRTTQFYVKLYLQDDILVKVDRASMMNSLEARSPFLDIELVDFVRRIPAEYRFRHGVTKYLLKKSLEPVLPKNILYRRKQGFGVPIGEWFREGYFASSSFFEPNNPLNNDFINSVFRKHRDKLSNQKDFLWNLLVLKRMKSKWKDF
jgi:asparagine synthase (glutamine-hydrolysing)